MILKFSPSPLILVLLQTSFVCPNLWNISEDQIGVIFQIMLFQTFKYIFEAAFLSFKLQE
jgi:hypothetical protein